MSAIQRLQQPKTNVRTAAAAALSGQPPATRLNVRAVSTTLGGSPTTTTNTSTTTTTSTNTTTSTTDTSIHSNNYTQYGVAAQRSNRANEHRYFLLNRLDKYSFRPMYYDPARKYLSASAQNSNNQFNPFNTLAMMQMLNQTMGSLESTIASAKSSNSSESKEKAFKYKEKIEGGDDYKNFAKAKSFTDLHAATNKAESTVKNFSTEYKKVDEGVKQTLSGDNLSKINTGLEAVGLSGIDMSKLKISDITIDTDDSSSYDVAFDTIDKDIQSAVDFANNLDGSLTNLNSKIGELGDTVVALTQKISSIQITLRGNQEEPKELTEAKKKLTEAKKKLTEAKKKLTEAEDAQKPLENAKKAADALVTELKSKKTELSDAKKILEEKQEKEYKLAEEKDKKIKDLIKQIDKKLAKGEDCTDLKNQMKTLQDQIQGATLPIKWKNKTFTKFTEIENKYLPDSNSDAAPATPAAPSSSPTEGGGG